MTHVQPLDTNEALSLLGGRQVGDDTAVTHILNAGAAVTTASVGAVVVLADATEAQLQRWNQLGVAALVMADAAHDKLPPWRAGQPARWLVADPRTALARLTRRLDPRPAVAAPGIHPSAVVDASAQLGAGVALGPLVTIGANAKIGDHVRLGAGASVGANASVGAGSELRERVVIADGVVVGRRCLIQAGAVIGGDGFGYAPGPRGAERIVHLGSVVIEDDVDIGAGTCIDRGTLGDTRVGTRTKIDNLVMVGHNVTIGCDVLIAGQSGIAGSTVVGDRVIMGGSVGVADHIRVGNDVRLAGGAGVTKSVPDGETWGGMPAQPVRKWIRERYLIGQLERIWARVKGET